jgi:hypothetical protein
MWSVLTICTTPDEGSGAPGITAASAYDYREPQITKLDLKQSNYAAM